MSVPDDRQALFRKLTEKYGPEPIPTSHVLKIFWPPRKKENNALLYARSSIEPIRDALEHSAEKIGGTILLQPHDTSKTLPPGSLTLNLELPDAGYSIIDAETFYATVAYLHDLVHNRHKIEHGRKTGILLADPDMDKQERRKIEKARSLKKQHDRDKRRK